jgi:hypothetical protein
MKWVEIAKEESNASYPIKHKEVKRFYIYLFLFKG